MAIYFSVFAEELKILHIPVEPIGVMMDPRCRSDSPMGQDS